MISLGIESTCDEAGAAIVKDGHIILSNVIASQIDHAKYKGVFPEIASRRHVEFLLPVISEAMKKAEVKPKDLDLISVAQKPGLIGSLLVGMNTAKALSLAWEIPFISVNHVHAHVYAAMMNKAPPRFPALGLVISGGHTLLLFMKSELDYEVIGTTIDDAVGEAFDKVATVLGLPYPGGPEIEKLAKKGNLDRFPLKPCVVKNSKTNFSFSGLKTRVLYEAKGKNSQKNAPLLINDQEKADLAAAFQHAALTDLVKKSYSACLQHDCSDLYVGGGVSNNRYLKKLFEKYKDSKINIHFPIPELTIDNGAMIAGLGSHLFNRQQRGESFDSFVEPTGKIHL